VWNTQVIAAQPELNTIACVPYSIAATHSYKAARVGLPPLE